MKLYFVRHGKAREYSPDGDYYRELTAEGREEIEESFSEFAENFNEDDKIYIYSSPLTRAVQTAEVMGQKLGRSTSILRELSGATLKELLLNLEDEDGIYILVSHVPFIPDWIRELTGENIKVKKGSIHLVEI